MVVAEEEEEEEVVVVEEEVEEVVVLEEHLTGAQAGPDRGRSVFLLRDGTGRRGGLDALLLESHFC